MRRSRASPCDQSHQSFDDPFRRPLRLAQATLPAPGAHHAAAQPSQAALRACKHGRHGRAQAWTARTA